MRDCFLEIPRARALAGVIVFVRLLVCWEERPSCLRDEGRPAVDVVLAESVLIGLVAWYETRICCDYLRLLLPISLLSCPHDPVCGDEAYCVPALLPCSLCSSHHDRIPCLPFSCTGSAHLVQRTTRASLNIHFLDCFASDTLSCHRSERSNP